MLKKQLKRDIQQSILAKKSLIKISSQINESIKILTECLKNGNKILICGNGGSAADAQHLAAEFLVRLRPNVNRKSLPVISLALDTSTLTACGNDYSFDKIFSRSLSAIGSENDVLISISTSGMSKNIINVIRQAKKQNIKTISFLGQKGGMAKKFSNLNLIVNSNNVARIQESHIFLGHFIFQKVEENIIKIKWNLFFFAKKRQVLLML